LFNYFPDEEKFSIIDVYLKAAKKEKIKAFLHNYSFWQDVGKVEDLARFK
jgi:NDP-sugar pyrophosphorylase family protein